MYEDSHTRMAKVNWSAGIDSVSGALSKPSKKGHHSCNKMLLGTHRTAATQNPNCNRIYIRKKVERSTPVTDLEQIIRTRFTAVSQAIKERKADLSKIAADQAAFETQKNQPGGKTTMKAWYWKVCGDEYDRLHPRGGE